MEKKNGLVRMLYLFCLQKKNKNLVANIPVVACMNPSEKGEGLVRAGIILCRKSMYFLPGSHGKKKRAQSLYIMLKIHIF